MQDSLTSAPDSIPLKTASNLQNKGLYTWQTKCSCKNQVISRQSLRGPVPHRTAKRNPRPVTIIIAIKCKDGLVLASDSELTYQASYTKRQRATKLNPITFKGGRIGILAESGSEDGSEIVYQALAKLAPETEIENDYELAGKTFEAAVRSLRTRIKEAHFECSDDDVNKIVREQLGPFELLLAFFAKGQARVFTIDGTFALAQERCRKDYYYAMGCGDGLARSLLDDLVSPNLDLNSGVAVAAFVTDAVIRKVTYCGGQVQIAVLKPEQPVPRPGYQMHAPPFILKDGILIVRPQDMPDLIDAVRKIDAESNAKRIEMISKSLNNLAIRQLNDVIRKVAERQKR
jgi:hypothetical protein